MASVNYNFEWDSAKAQSNRRKHGVSFEQAATVFLDPLAVSIVDGEHGENEERWVTLGKSMDDKLLVAIHTYRETGENGVTIRLISVRRATRHEQQRYEEIR